MLVTCGHSKNLTQKVQYSYAFGCAKGRGVRDKREVVPVEEGGVVDQRAILYLGDDEITLLDTQIFKDWELERA